MKHSRSLLSVFVSAALSACVAPVDDESKTEEVHDTAPDGGALSNTTPDASAANESTEGSVGSDDALGDAGALDGDASDGATADAGASPAHDAGDADGGALAADGGGAFPLTEPTLLDYDPDCRDWESDCLNLKFSGFPGISADGKFVVVRAGHDFGDHIVFHSIDTGEVVESAVLWMGDEFEEAQWELMENGATEIYDRIGERLRPAIRRISEGGYRAMLPAKQVGLAVQWVDGGAAEIHRASDCQENYECSGFSSDCRGNYECSGSPQFSVDTNQRAAFYANDCETQPFSLGVEGWFAPEQQVYAIWVREYGCLSLTPWVVARYDERSLAVVEERAMACNLFLDAIEPTAHDRTEGTEEATRLNATVVDETEALAACPDLEMAMPSIKPFGVSGEFRMSISRFIDEVLGLELVIVTGVAPEDCSLGRCSDYIFLRRGSRLHRVGPEVINGFGYHEGELALELWLYWGGNDATTYWARVVEDEQLETIRLVELP